MGVVERRGSSRSPSLGPIVVVGSGGQAKVVVDALLAGGWDVVGCTSRDRDHGNVLGVPIVGDDRVLPGLHAAGVGAVFVAIGDNAARESLSASLIRQGFRLPSIVSGAATISAHVHIGVGVAILPGAIVCADTVIGDYAIVNTGAIVDHDGLLGAASHIGPGASLAGGVRIGRRALVGVGCAIAPGVSVGDDVIVGAGSAVVRDIPADAIAYGNPALVRRQRNGV